MRLIALAAVIATCCASALAQEGRTRDGVRIIAPDLVAPPAVDPSSLERVEPRRPPRPPQPPAVKDDVRLLRATAIAAGVLVIDRRKVRLKDVRIIPPERLCEAREGGTWPCGMHARTAFRLWLRGRPVACDFAGNAMAKEDGGAGGETKARCSVFGEDAAAWLVEQGWALAEEGGSYTQLERQARDARRGVFSGGPRPR